MGKLAPHFLRCSWRKSSTSYCHELDDVSSKAEQKLNQLPALRNAPCRSVVLLHRNNSFALTITRAHTSQTSFLSQPSTTSLPAPRTPINKHEETPEGKHSLYPLRPFLITLKSIQHPSKFLFHRTNKRCITLINPEMAFPREWKTRARVRNISGFIFLSAPQKPSDLCQKGR